MNPVIRLRPRIGSSPAIAAIAIAALATVAQLTLSAPAQPRARAPETTVSTLRQSVVARVDLPGQPYRLAAEPDGRGLWFATLSIEGPDRLHRFDVGSREIESVELPDSAYNGFLTSVITDGSFVAVGQPYRLVSYHPDTRSMKSIELQEEVAGAAEDALDPDAANPGTWISGMGIESGEILMARNNVSRIWRYSPDLAQLGSRAVPWTSAGALDIAVGPGDRLYLASGLAHPAGVDILDADGSRIAHVDGVGARLRPSNGNIVLDSGLVASSAGSPITPGLRAHPGSRTYPHPDGGYVLYDAGRQLFARIADGVATRELRVPGEWRSIGRGDGSVVVADHPMVNDLVVDHSGLVWFIDADGPALVALDL